MDKRIWRDGGVKKISNKLLIRTLVETSQNREATYKAHPMMNKLSKR